MHMGDSTTRNHSVLLTYVGNDGDVHYYVGRDSGAGEDIGISVIIREME